MVVKSKWASFNGKKAQKAKNGEKPTQSQMQLMLGVKSGLEDIVAQQLTDLGVPFEYETKKIKYIEPAANRTYTPDFILGNGIIIETKGRWEAADRKKIKLIKAQYPELDIRMVFSRSKGKISKSSNTTYAMYCDKIGVPYADKLIPLEWIKE